MGCARLRRGVFAPRSRREHAPSARIPSNFEGENGMNLDWPRAREGARAELVLSGGSICERAQKSAHTNRHESPRFDHMHVGVHTWYMFDHSHVGVRTWYVAVTFGVNGTLSRKNTSVERSETDEKVDSSKFELECGVRNQNFFWLVRPFTTLIRKHYTAPCSLILFRVLSTNSYN